MTFFEDAALMEGRRGVWRDMFLPENADLRMIIPWPEGVEPSLEPSVTISADVAPGRIAHGLLTSTPNVFGSYVRGTWSGVELVLAREDCHALKGRAACYAVWREDQQPLSCRPDVAGWVAVADWACEPAKGEC